MDEQDIHCKVNLIRNFEAEIKPLLRLIMPTLQVLHEYQEEGVGGGKVFHRRTSKAHVPEEVK